MKTSPLDFVFCSIFTTVVGVLSFFSVRLFVVPFATPVFGDFAVLVYAFAFLIVFGLIVAICLRACMHFYPLPPGTFSMDHPTFTYWKLFSYVHLMGEACMYPIMYVPVFAPLRPWAYRLFGARIGSETAIGGVIDSPYLATIGDRSVIGARAYLAGNTILGGCVHIGTIVIGNDVTICMGAIILPNVRIGDRAVVDIGAVVLPGSVIPAGEKWRGNPARKWMDVP